MYRDYVLFLRVSSEIVIDWKIGQNCGSRFFYKIKIVQTPLTKLLTFLGESPLSEVDFQGRFEKVELQTTMMMRYSKF